MKSKILILLLTFLYFSTISQAAIKLDEDWSINEKVYDWDISYSGKTVALLGEDNYYIYKQGGELFLEGKNIWGDNYINITDKEFMLMDNDFAENHYFTTFQIYNYSGKFVRRGLTFQNSYFTPQGTFVISDYGFELFTTSNREGKEQEADQISLIYPLDNPYMSNIEDNHSYYLDEILNNLYISHNDRFLVTGYGIYENRNGSLEQVLDNYVSYDEIGYSRIKAGFIKDTDILVQVYCEIRKDNSSDYEHRIISQLYDCSMNLIWEKDDIIGILYAYDNGIIETDANQASIYNISGEFLCEVKVPEDILKIFTFSGKDYFLLQTKYGLYEIDFEGNVKGKIELEAPYIFSADGEAIYIYRNLDDPEDVDMHHVEDRPYSFQLTSYRVIVN